MSSTDCPPSIFEQSPRLNRLRAGDRKALMRSLRLLHIACPQLAKADIRAVRGHSGFDPEPPPTVHRNNRDTADLKRGRGHWPPAAGGQ